MLQAAKERFNLISEFVENVVVVPTEDAAELRRQSPRRCRYYGCLQPGIETCR